MTLKRPLVTISSLAFTCLVYAALNAQPAQAQLATSSANQRSGSAGPLVQDQGSEAVTEFEGLQVSVRRVLRTGENGGLRLVVAVTDMGGSSGGRSAAWLLRFMPTLIDDMGNEYVSNSIRGAIGGCPNDSWGTDAQTCWTNYSNLFTSLPPATPATAVLDFAPSDGHAMPDLMALATAVDFTGRIAVASEGGDVASAHLVINGLMLPE